MKTAIIKVENRDVRRSLQKFLGQLLENKFVDALLVPKMFPGGYAFVQTLIKDAKLLADVDPVAPTIAVQSARILSELTSGPFKGPIGVILKPCELRAAVELVKFLQVNLDNIVTIGIDCAGTYELRDYAELAKKNAGGLFGGIKDGELMPVNGYNFRQCCQSCEYPVPPNADIALGFFGYDTSQEILLTVGEKVEKDIVKKFSLRLEDGKSAERERVIQRVISKRRENRVKAMNKLKEDTATIEKLMQLLSTCIHCHNCMNVCPICYCKECVFKSTLFEHRPDQFLAWAGRKGAIRMPPDTLMFHLTRMSHMATSCVGCGMCESACPNQLPVSSLFSLIGDELQNVFGYQPGRDTAEKPPVSVFKEDELQDAAGGR